jgi:hypothetical protein
LPHTAVLYSFSTVFRKASVLQHEWNLSTVKNIHVQEQNILIVGEEFLHYCSKFMDSVGVNSLPKDLIYFSFTTVKFRLIEAWL